MMDNRKHPAAADTSSVCLIGRESEFDQIMRFAADPGATRGLVVSSAPDAGTSPLLRKACEEVFRGAGDVIPVYFALKIGEKNGNAAAARFLKEFVQQTIAFRRRDPRLLNSAPDTAELTGMALPSDIGWIGPLIEKIARLDSAESEPGFIRYCLNAPLRSPASGKRSLVVFDDLHNSLFFSDGKHFLNELVETAGRPGSGYLLAAHRRMKIDVPDAARIVIDPLSAATSGSYIAALAGETGVAITDQTRDLIAEQLQGKPLLIKHLFEAAAERPVALDTYRSVIQTYAEELHRGRIGAHFEDKMGRVLPDAILRNRLIGYLYDLLKSPRGSVPIEAWRGLTSFHDDDFGRLIERLYVSEIIDTTVSSIEFPVNDHVLADAVKLQHSISAAGGPAHGFAELLTGSLKRAPQLMARHYRRGSALGLKRLMTRFDCQEVPLGWFDYGIYREEYKGVSENEHTGIDAASATKVKLPQIIHSDFASAYYPQIAALTDDERCVVGVGFENSSYTDDDQVAWIAAEIDSKLEVDKESTEFWCDRLEMAAVSSGLSRFRIWLVSPEGFVPEAVEALRLRAAFGSCRKQAERLVNFLAGDSPSSVSGVNEFEMVVPMGEDIELIAAHAVEEIAKRYKFPAKAINQIKTALVEACINATEHSQSPDRKIYQKFSVDDEKMTVTVSNRGLRLVENKVAEPVPTEGRRGWGLTLIKGLMDEVKIESVDDGTRISMTKYLKRAAGNGST